VLWLVLKEGARFCFVGVALGLTGAFAVTRLLSSELYGISALDTITYVSVIVVMTVVTLLACYIPARRAAKVDPMTALRYE
jgi:ABC-type antimicrobial peptide transport system permease subunit